MGNQPGPETPSGCTKSVTRRETTRHTKHRSSALQRLTYCDIITYKLDKGVVPFQVCTTALTGRQAMIASKRIILARALLRAAVRGAVGAGVRQIVLRNGFTCIAKYALRGAFVGLATGTVTFLFTSWTAAALATSVVRTVVERKLPTLTC